MLVWEPLASTIVMHVQWFLSIHQTTIKGSSLNPAGAQEWLLILYKTVYSSGCKVLYFNFLHKCKKTKKKNAVWTYFRNLTEAKHEGERKTLLVFSQHGPCICENTPPTLWASRRSALDVSLYRCRKPLKHLHFLILFSLAHCSRYALSPKRLPYNVFMKLWNGTRGPSRTLVPAGQDSTWSLISGAIVPPPPTPRMGLRNVQVCSCEGGRCRQRERGVKERWRVDVRPVCLCRCLLCRSLF